MGVSVWKPFSSVPWCHMVVPFVCGESTKCLIRRSSVLKDPAAHDTERSSGFT